MPHHRTRRHLLACTIAIVSAGLGCRQHESGANPDTFAGATVRLIAGFSAGGPYDLHARLTANVLGRYLPGHPNVIVENMPGAASAVAANHLATVATPDGLTFALLTETSAPVAIESDLAGRFQLLGSPGAPPTILFFSKQSGITTLDSWRHAARPPRFGSTGIRAPTAIVPMVVSAALGLPMKMIAGYSGAGELRQAFDGGEIDALCLTLDAFHTMFPADPGVHIALRVSSTPIPGVDVPDAMALAPDAHARDLLDTGVYAMAGLIRFYAAPRTIPAARLALLRDGLTRAWADKDFLAAASAAGLMIAPISGDALDGALRIVAQRPSVVADLRAILTPR